MKGDTNLLIRIAAAFFIVLCLVSIIELQVRMNTLNAEKEKLNEQLKELREDVAELNYRIGLPYDKNYAAKVARDILGYHYPDELLFINDRYGE